MDLDDRPIALFGANGSGKTNLLEAISLLSPGRGLRRARAEEIIRRPEAIGWKVQATISAGGPAQEVVLRAEPGAARSTEINGKAAPQIGLANLLRMVWLVPSQDRLWIEGAEGRRRFLDRLTMSFYPEHGEAVLTYEKSMRERNRLFKEGVANLSWFRALELQMAEAASRIVKTRRSALARLQAAQAIATTSFPTADLSLEEVEEIDEADDFARAFEANRRRDEAAGRTLIGPHRTDLAALYLSKNAPARFCSTGEQKALLISLILANARALQEELGAAPIILLDEVAAHLDQSRREALFDEICALGSQAWMTGTGPELFEELGARAQRIEVSEIDGISRVELINI